MMNLPKLDDLIDEQMTAFEQPFDQHMFVVGPPGSGKTALAVLRARQASNEGKRVVLVTKNRMLAALAKQQLEGIRCVTMNAYVSTEYMRLDRGYIPELRRYVYDWDRVCADFAEDGAKAPCDHLIVDEGQNLPAGFFRWAIAFGGGFLTVFADENQTTNDEHASLSDIRAAGLPAPIRLTRNHRNTPEIARVAEHFHRAEHAIPAIAVRPRSGDIPELIAVADWDALATRIAYRFQNQAGSIGVIVGRKDDTDVLRANLLALLPGGRVDAYTSNSEPGQEDAILTYEPGITVLTDKAVIGLEFDAVFLQGVQDALPCRTLAQFRQMYMLCARAKHMLTVVNGVTPLSKAQIDALPPPNLLTR
ncbi:ATP-binding protein [Pseudoduganella plicata]|uniref:DUF2075 domain-containing protein n=1 Tax=Pseudoduganella plicata TaxID=321984 RepID=A0A4P7BE04_9BURK|nr:ATP-binding protein [Pseudoduganella plicata]QBQ36814.1 DUF2075 domain-containing protein [Pseudoduganella plicata]GGY72499.1 hypothetical protein GCM10007388_00640 [Pseudoduganella plicata]